ncbi:MAG: shikimate dehydrogenase [Dysgonamonadaceae bacterium]|jgi:shikimate dehydrogenase|nr:shikimate dehydrogenase [Dysgonamonadaceae bacterium]
MDLYGLIGYPLSHSFSRSFFNDKFAAEQIDAQYVNFEIPSIQEFKSVIKNNPALKGLNVTIPYKEQVIPFLDKINDDSKQIGAVNVIAFNRSKGKLKLIGYNSDIIGFKNSIEPLIPSKHEKALVLGTGGSAKAIYLGLKQLGVDPVYVSREKISPDMLTYAELLPEVMESHTIIVNCTPVGMWPNVDACPDIPYHLLTKKHLLYDLLYNPNETLFMKEGKKRGATVKNGLEMLLLQAFAGWDFWQGIVK